MAIAVLIELQVKPECVEAMKTYFKEIHRDTRAYQGCLGVDIYRNMDDGANLVLYQRWESRPHFERYLAWRAETGVVDQLEKMLAEPSRVRYLDLVDA